ncbi:MAG: radical SAM protein [Actinobacteria bacterium]|nr:radical SAM protein [Actinomycetota bacterium]MCL5446152.1 radical SAM protein [Actinomycetota bacterium]
MVTVAGTAASPDTGLGRSASYRQLHFDRSARPFLVLWELTRACDLACVHCRAESVPLRSPDELATDEIKRVLDDLASLGAPRPIVVLTGGDPFKRPDLNEIVYYGSQLSLRMAVAPSGTPLATGDNLMALRQAGATAVSFSIDGAGAGTHDRFRRVPGSFDLTVNASQAAVSVGLHLQVNTTVCAETVEELPGIVHLVRSLGAGLWSVFFLVPTGRGKLLRALTDQQVEDVLYFLAEVSSEVIPAKTTEAPQFRRVLVQRESAMTGQDERHGLSGRYDPAARTPLYTRLMAGIADLLPSAGMDHLNRATLPGGSAAGSGGSGASISIQGAGGQGGRSGGGAGEGTSRAGGQAGSSGEAGRRTMRRPLVVGDGYGVVFISHTGDISPSGFLPMVAGNVRESSLMSVYRESEMMNALRNVAGYRGRCGTCEYRGICGGSRSQAFAAYGDPLAEDPNCPYEPSGVTTDIVW